jgi:hypothetical protein
MPVNPSRGEPGERFLVHTQPHLGGLFFTSVPVATCGTERGQRSAEIIG